MLYTSLSRFTLCSVIPQNGIGNSSIHPSFLIRCCRARWLDWESLQLKDWKKRAFLCKKKIEVDDVHIFLTHKTIYLLSSATWLDELMPISPMLWVHKFYFASGKFLNGGASLYGRLTWHDVRLFIKKARFIDRLVMRWKKFNDWQNFYIDPHHPIKIWNYSKWHRHFCTK